MFFVEKQAAFPWPQKPRIVLALLAIGAIIKIVYLCVKDAVPMAEFREKYVNPFTDFGFKRLFGEELNKDLLMDFLNELLKEEQGEIVELTYLKTEHLGATELNRRAIFDLYCTNVKGEKFIVELQKTKQKFFKDRTLYYSTFPIQEQAVKGSEWDFELKKVYTIAILDFVFDEDKKEPEKYRYDVKLSDIQTQIVFYDKLTFIYLQMPKFNKGINELETRFEKWMFILKNLHKLSRIPEKLRESIFQKLFLTAEIAKFNKIEHQNYEDSLKYYRDLKNSLDTAKAEGLAEGLAEGEQIGIKKGEQIGIKKGEQNILRKIAQKAKKSGMPVKDISELTGLSEEEISDI